MRIGGYQQVSLQDYPGHVAAIVFTVGCPLRCPYCHNPEMVLNPQEQPDRSEEFFAYLHLRRKLLDGVVITGGEPLIHEDIIDQIRRIKDLGLAVKLDTNGLFPDKLQMLIDQRLIDHVALDFKHERSAWLKTVGMLQETQRLEQWYPLWERSLLFLQQESITYELRTTVVRQLHSSDGLLAMAKYLVSQRLDLSKVHWYLQSFRYHYPLLCDQQPDANYPKLSAYDPAEMRMIQARLQQYIPNVILREI